MSNSKGHPKNKSNHAKRLSRQKAVSYQAQSSSKEVSDSAKNKDSYTTVSRSRKVLTIVLSIILIAAFAVPSVTALYSCST